MLEAAISQQHGEKEELLGHLNQFKEDRTSADQSSESMVGKIQVRRKAFLYLFCFKSKIT